MINFLLRPFITMKLPPIVAVLRLNLLLLPFDIVKSSPTHKETQDDSNTMTLTYKSTGSSRITSLSSICTDEPGWSTFDPNGPWTGQTCSDIDEGPTFWCTFLSSYPYQGMTSNDACCSCGGGTTVQQHAPSMTPSAAPSDCVNEPDWVWSIQGGQQNTCDSVTTAFCATLSSVWYNGKNANLACCACGGGVHVPTAPSAMPSAAISSAPSTSPSAAPSDAPTMIPSVTPSALQSDNPTVSSSIAPSTDFYHRCHDEVGWSTYDPSGFWSGMTCSNISEYPSFWCIFLSSYTNQGLSTYDACCACGGGNIVQLPRTEEPSILPSAAPSQCVDQPNWF